ncbi:MAG: extracellular solute-binding protein [Chloroflexota bacterium]
MLQFSVCGADTVATKTQESLEPFNRRLRSVDRSFQVVAIPWSDYRNELTRMAIYGQGMDVAQVGARLANDLQAMNALRPFTSAEIDALGGEAGFLPVAWKQTNRLVDGQVWTLPWLLDPRGFLYWRDMLEDAGIDEATAFQNAENTEETLQRLKAAGVEIPLALPVGNESLAGQASCSWVWQAGGDFVSAYGANVLFTEPAFLKGLGAYFRLAPYLYHKGGALQMVDDANTLFMSRRAAVLYAGMWPVADIIAERTHPLRSRLGLSVPSGPPITAGSNLAVWNFSRYETEAVNLVKYLLDREVQRQYPLRVDHLPVRTDVIEETPYSDDPILAAFVQLAKKSRSFPNFQLCGLLEGMYNTAIRRIWSKIAAQPDAEIDVLIYQASQTLERRFRGWAS